MPAVGHPLSSLSWNKSGSRAKREETHARTRVYADEADEADEAENQKEEIEMSMTTKTIIILLIFLSSPLF